MKRVWLSLLAVWTVWAVSSPAICNDQFEHVRAIIRKAVVEEQLPSVAVGVASNGKILWEQGFGWADRENRIPATEHTMYSLASVSKTLTATGLMVLVERGRIDLDRPINDYLGETKLKACVGSAAEATVRRVLPLGMIRSSLNVGPRLQKDHAVRYRTDGRPIPFYVTDHPGASEFYASVHDLL